MRQISQLLILTLTNYFFVLDECVHVWMAKYISLGILCYCASFLVCTFFALCLCMCLCEMLAHVWICAHVMYVCTWMFDVCVCALGVAVATQVVQTSTKWMQSWERRWWRFGQTYRRRPWTCWSHRTRVSCGKTRHSGVCVSDHQLTKRTASASQCHSQLCISWSGHYNINT